MRVLVTGDQGYIGAALVPRLASAGHEVVGLDVRYYAGDAIGPQPGPVNALRLDVRDVSPEHIARIAPDAVIHLAALSNDALGDLHPDLTYDINVLGCLNVARAAKQAGVSRFLFSSSCSLYGPGHDGSPLDEAAPVMPLTPYADSKIRAELGLARLADERFSPVFLRNATAYGFSPHFRTDLVVNDLVGTALLTGEVRLQSDGTAWRPLVHVDDIAAAFEALLTVPRESVHGLAFNVGRTSENYRIRDVAELVADALGVDVAFAGGSTTDARNYRVSCDFIAERVPAFRPAWNVATGIEQMVECYRQFGLRLEDYAGPRFRRLPRIKTLLDSGGLDESLRWTKRA